MTTNISVSVNYLHLHKIYTPYIYIWLLTFTCTTLVLTSHMKHSQIHLHLNLIQLSFVIIFNKCKLKAWTPLSINPHAYCPLKTLPFFSFPHDPRSSSPFPIVLQCPRFYIAMMT